MTIPAEDVMSSASDWLFTVIDELRDLPHVDKVTEITALWTSLKEQKKQKLWPAQEDSELQNLQQNARLNASRLAAKWRKGSVLLVFERLTFVKELRNAFKDIRKSFDQLQVPSKDQIVEQLDNVIVSLCEDGGAYIELNNAEAEFRKQFFDFLRENRSKSDAISVITWLANRLDTDVNSVRQELEENEGYFLEELLLYVTKLEERNCASDGEEDAKSDEIDFGKKALDEVARGAVQNLGSPQMHWVLTGLDDLLKCTKLPNGRLEVFKAGAIPEAIRLAQWETQYINEAMTLLEALTSSGAGEEGVRGSESRYIYLHISNHLDFLITLMKDQRHPKARLLAAKTVVNMLVNSQVWRTVRTKYNIVSALLAILNEDKSAENGKRADRVCLVGLRHLAEFSPKKIRLKGMSPGDKTHIIVTALMKLLRDGFNGTVLENLAKDTLVALDTQVLVTDKHRAPSREVCEAVRSQLLQLMVTTEFIVHSTMAGRMAIISLMTKLCGWYTDSITEGLFLYLLKMIKETGSEIMRCSGAGENVDDLTKLLDLSVKLLCYCVTHGKDKAQAVLTKNVAERKTLEVMLEEQISGVLDESKLEILEIFDLIDPTVRGKVAVLVKMAKSQSPPCCERVASRLLKFVEESLDVTEMQEAGGINALMDLLKLENENCQKDALLALYLLSQSMTIQTEELPFQVILGFLKPKWPKNVKGAAVGLLALMVKENDENAAKFMDTPEALKTVLHFLDRDAESPGSQQCASALLKMATEDKNASVRLGIAEWGLSVLIRFVRKHGTVDHKQLLTTTLGLLCESGNGCEEAVTRAGGHTFLLTSLEENISKEVAAQGLLSLISNVRTTGDVLDAGFVDIAMGSIDRKFASTEMALGLASICSTSDWLDQIVACRRSVGALLILLERCPTLKGKGAAAAVIAKLYPRLTDSKRQEEMTEACSHLVKSLEHDDRSQLTAFLKALAAFATGRKGRQTIHEERGQIPLIRFLKAKETDTQVRDLVLQILAEMSSVFPEGTTKRDSSYHKILNVFTENMIGELICPLPWEAEFKKNTESMKNVLILIRNLSLAGPAVVAHLSECNAVPMLLHVLTDHDSAITPVTELAVKPLVKFTPVTELAVKALVKFTDDPNGKRAFLSGGGIKSLAAVLKLDVPRTSDVKSITTIILASVAQDRRTGTVACEAIFNCNILSALNTIMYEGETNRIKWQAAVLMKLLATTGPTQKVCAAIYQAGTLDALNYLRDVPHCEEIANDVLKIVRGANKDCKRYIDENMRKPK